MPEESSVSSSGSGEEKPCSSTTAAAADSSVDVMDDAKKLIGTGNRHLVMGDVVSAVSVFQEACSMLAAKYGDTADECGEAFFLCGKSLLELARMENSVLGNALEGVPEEEGEEEEQPNNSNIESASNLDEKTREELRKQVYDAMAEKVTDTKLKSEDQDSTADLKEENCLKPPVKNVTGSNNPLEFTVNVEERGLAQEAAPNASESPSAPVTGEEENSPGKETLTDNVEASKEQYGDVSSTKDEDSKTETELDEEEPEGNDGEDDDDDDDGEENGQDKEEEEVGNLQLAWEMLEVAKVIFKRKETRDDQLLAAQAYLKLGEVSAESGNYPQALEDFQECLALQLKHLPPHSRLLAETHYHVATTLCYVDQYSQAIQHYNSSIKVIETRLAMLQELIAAAKGENAAADKNEMEELKLLLPDIREKVEDAKESQRTASAASQAIQQTLVVQSAINCETTRGCLNLRISINQNTFFQIAIKSSDSAASSSKGVSDISHLVRKKRKPEEESPVKDTDAKQAKPEATVNGNGDSTASNGNGVQERKSQEASYLHSATLPRQKGKLNIM
ncbi:Nuclear autoantigenic sperm protein [Channa argus]|uniref:Nuclear autoantigenic sperm protein n=1 Tax=Channa argus TaxID=215402 RepID=A0A6G1PKG8_CHAAH|nr:Nuclear autoantigenic sperm protein [Channa argus]